jgi:hypothetical protein
VEPEVLTLSEPLSSPPVFSVCLAIVLSVLLQFTDPDYPFGIFNIFLFPLGDADDLLKNVPSKLDKML